MNMQLPPITVPPLNAQQFGRAMGFAIEGLPFAIRQLGPRDFGLTLTSGRPAVFRITTHPDPARSEAAELKVVATVVNDADEAEAAAIVQHIVMCLPFSCEVVAGWAQSQA
jgi:hypothetical protein